MCQIGWSWLTFDPFLLSCLGGVSSLIKSSTRTCHTLAGNLDAFQKTWHSFFRLPTNHIWMGFVFVCAKGAAGYELSRFVCYHLISVLQQLIIW